jgi:PEP-CTERM motif
MLPARRAKIMPRFTFVSSLALVGAVALLPARAAAGPITLFSTGNPDGKIATLSRPAGPGLLETETADDFILGQNALVSSATFVGLLSGGALVPNVTGIEIELYHVFPADSINPPDGRVVTRTNSPSDNQFAAFDSALGQLSFSASVLNPSFTAANSVVNGINPSPNQFTGGEGPVTGEEVQFNITFTTPFFVGATDHDFFRPEVALSSGNFLWLSAPKPIVSPGTALQFPGGPGTDLQSWIRNTSLAPDWERIGTDVTGQGPFNATFSLSGQPVAAAPEPASLLLLASGLCGAAWSRRRSPRR